MQEPLRHLARDAYDAIQYACNMSGIVKLLVTQLSAGPLCEVLDPHEYASHPILQVIADKMDDLARTRAMALPFGTPGTVWGTISGLERALGSLTSSDTAAKNEHPEVQARVLELVRLTQSRTQADAALEACKRLANGSTLEQLLVSLNPLLYHDTRDSRLYQWLLLADGSVIHMARAWKPREDGFLDINSRVASEARGFRNGIQATASGEVRELTATEWAQWQQAQWERNHPHRHVDDDTREQQETSP